VIAVDAIGDRPEAARAEGAEIVDYERDHPVESIKEMTRGIGPDRVIDAVGVDAEPPQGGPAADVAGEQGERFAQQGRPGHPGGDREERAVEAGIGTVAGARLGRPVRGDDRHPVDHRRLSARHGDVRSFARAPSTPPRS
jgi:threonine dehydrogenase-like Zn-dependent dehydrogenase